MLKMFGQASEIPGGNMLLIKLFSFKSLKKSLDLDLQNFTISSQNKGKHLFCL